MNKILRKDLYIEAIAEELRILFSKQTKNSYEVLQMASDISDKSKKVKCYVIYLLKMMEERNNIDSLIEELWCVLSEMGQLPCLE